MNPAAALYALALRTGLPEPDMRGLTFVSPVMVDLGLALESLKRLCRARLVR